MRGWRVVSRNYQLIIYVYAAVGASGLLLTPFARARIYPGAECITTHSYAPRGRKARAGSSFGTIGDSEERIMPPHQSSTSLKPYLASITPASKFTAVFALYRKLMVVREDPERTMNNGDVHVHL